MSAVRRIGFASYVAQYATRSEDSVKTGMRTVTGTTMSWLRIDVELVVLASALVLLTEGKDMVLLDRYAGAVPLVANAR